MSNNFISLALGVISEKITTVQKAKANRALKNAQQSHLTKIKKQRKKRK